jgi:hypothetical protein
MTRRTRRHRRTIVVRRCHIGQQTFARRTIVFVDDRPVFARPVRTVQNGTFLTIGPNTDATVAMILVLNCAEVTRITIQLWTTFAQRWIRTSLTLTSGTLKIVDEHVA